MLNHSLEIELTALPVVGKHTPLLLYRTTFTSFRDQGLIPLSGWGSTFSLSHRHQEDTSQRKRNLTYCLEGRRAADEVTAGPHNFSVLLIDFVLGSSSPDPTQLTIKARTSIIRDWENWESCKTYCTYKIGSCNFLICSFKSTMLYIMVMLIKYCHPTLQLRSCDQFPNNEQRTKCLTFLGF